MEAKTLTISQVAKIAGCCRETIYNYEREGYIESVRDCNNYRRYSMAQALTLKKMFETRKPGPKPKGINSK